MSVSLTCHKIELWLISGFNYHHSSTMLVPCSKGVDQPAITHTVLVVTRVYNSLLSHSISLAGKVLLREFPNINGLVSLLKKKNFSQFLKHVHTGLSVSQKRTASLPAIGMTLALRPWHCCVIMPGCSMEKQARLSSCG